MSVLLWVAVPVAVVAVLCAALYWRQNRLTSIQSGVEEFSRELRALAPEQDRRARPPLTGPGPDLPGGGAG